MKVQLKNLVKSAFAIAGIDVKRRLKSPYQDFLIFENDPFFSAEYERGLALTSTPSGGVKRKARFFNLLQFYSSVRHLEGRSAECGCWKGLSSYMICKYEQRFNPEFEGESHEIYDSFEGLSEFSGADEIVDPTLVPHLGSKGGNKGDFAAGQDQVRYNLREFGELSLHKGWIPEVFPVENNKKYKFVHVDVDLYEPTLASFEYFFPKIVPGGVIICDDYGSLRWPGAKRAVEEFCRDRCRYVVLSTGQAVIYID